MSYPIMNLRYTASKEFRTGIPVTVSVTTSGYEGGDRSDLTVTIQGDGFFVGTPNVNDLRASISFRGDNELSMAPEIFEFAADAIRSLLRDGGVR